MRQNTFIKTVVLLFAIIFLAPSTFLAAPPTAHAQLGLSVPTGDWYDTIQNTISAVSAGVNTAANVAEQVNTYVLKPLAFALSGDLMRSITSDVLSFVSGKANGTGLPQFVTSISKSTQTVADARASAFISQVGATNSPFTASISSSLNVGYLSGTSLGGFGASNMNTLAASSPTYTPEYLKGDWGKGGVSSWFALTTQDQNNPYTLQHAAQSQLGTVVGPGVGGATGAHLADISNGQGYLSWCGPSGTDASSASAVNPDAPCTNKDGTEGTIKTPGSTIKASLDKALSGTQEFITNSLGDAGPEINSILNNIGAAINSVNSLTSILGSATGGLADVGSVSASNPTSVLGQLRLSQGNFGVTTGQVYQNAASLPSSGSDMLNKVKQYQDAWNTIRASANVASASVSSLADFCTAAATTAKGQLQSQTNPTLQNALQTFINASTAQASNASGVIGTEIASVLVQADQAAATAAAATAMVQKAKNDLTATGGAPGASYTSDMNTLQTMPPTLTDVATAQGNARIIGAAMATPVGSLTVTASSLIDQMNLINTNAQALKASVCTYKPPTISGISF